MRSHGKVPPGRAGEENAVKLDAATEVRTLATGTKVVLEPKITTFLGVPKTLNPKPNSKKLRKGLVFLT